MLVKFGNHKLGKDTLIFNMETSRDCPSRRLGLCKVVENGIRCYAEKPEKYAPKTVLPYRLRQRTWWRTTSKEKILEYLSDKIKRRRTETKYFRYNESGDFNDQKDIEKLSYIAKELKKRFGIVTYGNSARSDLNFKGVSFLVKGSGHSKGNNGKSIVIKKGEDIPKGYYDCPADCRECSVCKMNKKINVAFRKH